MTVGLVYLPLLQFLDDTGVALPGAKLFSYLAGTSTPAALYAESTGVTPLPNPAIADAGGRLLAYGVHGQAYKLNLLDTHDVQQPGWPVDHLIVTPPSVATAPLAGLVCATSTVPFVGIAGAPSLVASGALPASKLILFVQLTVTQPFGASQGAASLALGDQNVADRWGRGMTLAVGVKPLTQGGLPLYPTAMDLLLSMEEGLFDGTGAATAQIWTLAPG